MISALSCGSTSSGDWAKCQPSAVLVRVQITSNLSSGHSDGGVGVTPGKASAMAGISPCCHEINVGPGWAMTCSTSSSSSPLPKRVSTGMPSSVGERLHGLAGPLRPRRSSFAPAA